MGAAGRHALEQMALLVLSHAHSAARDHTRLCDTRAQLRQLQRDTSLQRDMLRHVASGSVTRPVSPATPPAPDSPDTTDTPDTPDTPPPGTFYRNR